MKVAPMLACTFLAASALPALPDIPRALKFRFCEHENTLAMAEIAMNAVRYLGEATGSSYYRNAVSEVYNRTSDNEWEWIEPAHERILGAILDHRQREGRYMIELDESLIISACVSVIPRR